MKAHYRFKEKELEEIVSNFGEDFREKLLKNIQEYSNKWKLTCLQFIHSSSLKCVFFCYSELYGDVVLKIGKPCKELYTELNTLLEYNGSRFCRVFASDIETGIIIEERIQPGNTLWEGASLDQRLSVFCSLYNGLHIAPKKTEIYPTYIEWISRITDYMSRRQDCKDLYLHMKKAEDLCLSVCSIYSEHMLLHGDIHQDNILLGKNDEYKLIDPKGVVGDPVFDIAQFIWNEFGDETNDDVYKKINYILNTFEARLKIPYRILIKCLYIQTTMCECWMVQDGSTPSFNKINCVETILQCE